MPLVSGLALTQAGVLTVEFDGGRTSVKVVVLTVRQLGVLRLMAAGYNNARIAARLSLAENTVKVHTRRIYKALGARDRAHAVAIGFRLGLLIVDGDRPT